MKYMGSKRAMLRNGLGELLANEVPKHRRFIDLFAGSAAVAKHVSLSYPIETHAYDLQLYSKVLASAVLERTRVLDSNKCWLSWKHRADEHFSKFSPPNFIASSKENVSKAREWCAAIDGSLVNAFGGHYYSPTQACWIESFRATLPLEQDEKIACLAALIMASSKCAAAPGHTAQPFQPTSTAIKFLSSSWERDIVDVVRVALTGLSCECAVVQGYAAVGEANNIANKLLPEDLVFLDPPYSAVQYSRFYHVLEAIAKGTVTPVNGVGRYVPHSERPISAYSTRSNSKNALKELLQTLSQRGSSVLLTFPDHECSNGISGDVVRALAADNFHVVVNSVSSIFSTLGGPADGGNSRSARRQASELMLLLKAK